MRNGFGYACVFSLLTVFWQPVLAENFANSSRAQIDYTATPITAQQRCADLVATSGFEYTVLSSKAIAATASVPAYCRVSGLVQTEIRFEVNLPLNWNGRLYMYGNGGLAGTPAIDPQRQQARDRALAHGFATAYTDTGHDKRVHPGGTFAHNNLHKLVDYGFRAVHLTVSSAKLLATHLYGTAPAHSYFNGCSTGGRQAMLSAQRFPADFDGIIAGAPAADYSGLKFSQAWRVAAISQSGLDEDEVLQLAEHIYARCDHLDGQKDGLLDDPRLCDFDIDRHLPRCAGEDKVDCFSEQEMSALRRYYEPVTLAGREVYPAMPVGSEVLGAGYDGSLRTGWFPWLINDEGPVLLDLLGSDFFRYMAFVQDRPSFDWTTFDFAEEPDNLQEFRDIVDALSPDLSVFRDRGGKLLSYFGWADPDINPLTLLDYRDQVAELDKGFDSYFKTFMIPGMFHCRGGAGPDRFDAMTPLIDWVEGDSAPARLEVWREKTPGQRTDTSQVCAYPGKRGDC
ncbi:MAG: tannase/feruloyl esterase family alpha/beta hydrolase [Pseudomonadota bacterium]